MIPRPPDLGAFEFVVLATLRAAQLMRGCRPKVDGVHKATIMAQREVSAGKVTLVFEGAGSASLLLGAAPVDDERALTRRKGGADVEPQRGTSQISSE